MKPLSKQLHKINWAFYIVWIALIWTQKVLAVVFAAGGTCIDCQAPSFSLVVGLHRLGKLRPREQFSPL